MNNDSLLHMNCLEWLKYSDYEYVADKNGELYIKPTADSVLKIYDPSPLLTDMMLDAVNIGYGAYLLSLSTVELQKKVLTFIKKYGLLGLINAFTISGDYSKDLSVEFRDFSCFNKDTLKTKEYIKLFSHFGNYNNAEKDKNVITLVALTRPLSYIFIFSKEYSEKYDWILYVFKKLAKVIQMSQTYAEQQFEISGLSFVVKTGESASIVWNFTSLSQGIDTVLGFYIANQNTPLRSCKHCSKVFVAKLASTEFCSSQCRNQFNVYKSRGKK